MAFLLTTPPRSTPTAHKAIDARRVSVRIRQPVLENLIFITVSVIA
jgi:hypothetical protein